MKSEQATQRPTDRTKSASACSSVTAADTKLLKGRHQTTIVLKLTVYTRNTAFPGCPLWRHTNGGQDILRSSLLELRPCASAADGAHIQINLTCRPAHLPAHARLRHRGLLWCQ